MNNHGKGNEMFTQRGLFIRDWAILGPQLNKQVHVSFCANQNQQELWIENIFVSILCAKNGDMADKKFHIGKLVQERLKYEERSISWLARKIGCDRSNVYRIFEREHLDSELLMKLSVVLDYNFFEVYAKMFGEMKEQYDKNKKDVGKLMQFFENAYGQL